MKPSSLHTKRFDNGFQFIGCSRTGDSTVSIELWIGSGSGHESSQHIGAAHFLEHMVFRGSERYSASIIPAHFEAYGSILNAYTTVDSTTYHTCVPTHAIRDALQIMFDMVTAPLLKHTDIEIEREIILEELAEEADHSEAVGWKNMMAMTYAEHGYGRSIVGSEEGLKSLERDTLLDYHQLHYHANNMLLVIVGDFEPQALNEWLASSFGKLSKKPRRAVEPYARYYAPGQGLAINRSPFYEEHSTLTLALPGAAIGHDDGLSLDLAAALIAGREFSPVYYDLYTRDRSVRNIESYNYSMVASGEMVLMIQCEHAQLVPALRRSIRGLVEVAHASQESALTSRWLDTAKHALYHDMVSALETNEGICNELGFFSFFYGSLDPFFAYPQRLTAIDEAQIANAMRSRLSSLDSACMSVLYDSEEKNPIQDADIRSVVQAELAALTDQPIRLRRSSGVQPKPFESEDFDVHYLSSPSRDHHSAIALAIPGGIQLENPAINGVGSLALGAVAKGGHFGSELEITESLTRLGATFEAQLGRSSTIISVELPAPKLLEGAALMADFIRSPRWNTEFIEREKISQNDEIQAHNDDFDYDCYQNMLQLLFPQHSASLPLLGTQEAVKKLRSVDVTTHYQNRLLAGPWHVAVVGPEECIERCAYSLRKPDDFASNALWSQCRPAPSQPTNAHHHHIERPSEKAYMAVGFRLPQSDSPWWQYGEVLATLLNLASPGSLYHVLREQEALAYSVSASSYCSHRTAYMAIQLNCSTDKLQHTYERMLDQLEELPATISRHRLDLAINYNTLSARLERQRSIHLASAMAIHGMYGLPIDVTELETRARAISDHDFREFCMKYIRPEHAVIVTTSSKPFDTPS